MLGVLVILGWIILSHIFRMVFKLLWLFEHMVSWKLSIDTLVFVFEVLCPQHFS